MQAWLVVVYAAVVQISITGAWIVLAIGIALWLLAEAFELVEQPRQSQSPGEGMKKEPFRLPIVLPPLVLPLSVFAICVTVSGVLAGGLEEGLDSFLTLRALVVYFWSYQVFVKHPHSRSMTLATLLCVGAVTGIWGTIQQLFDFHPGEKFKYLQATGFTNNPMAFAGQMEVTASIALALLLTKTHALLPGKLSNTALFALITVCNLAGLFFASERSAWLGMMIAILLMAACISRRAFMRMALALIVTVAVAWFAVPVVQKRIVPLLTNFQADISTRVRLTVWEASLDIWQQQPIFGVGIRNYPRLDIPEAIVPGKSLYLVHAHSNYLHVLTTLGVVGLLGYLYLLGSTVMLALRSWRAKGDESSLDRTIALGTLSATVSLIVAGFFEYNFGTGNIRLIYWFVLSLIGLRPLLTYVPANSQSDKDKIGNGALKDSPAQ